MKLCAIYNVWADWDILEYSLKNIAPLVEGVIIVGSNTSNYGEKFPIPEWVLEHEHFFLREPQYRHARDSETDKRNYGLQIAKRLDYTHFLSLDADEMYEPESFLKAKARFLNEDIAGLVCPTRVYFGSPTLTIGFDGTRVTFIHKLTTTSQHVFNKQYPFAWDKRRICIDPTRSLNITSGVEYTEEVITEHYSWYRDDINRKIRNSSAKTNLERSTVLTDYVQAKEGYYCQFYGKVLTRVPNRFNIPEVWTS
jgi:hypothetical protein